MTVAVSLIPWETLLLLSLLVPVGSGTALVVISVPDRTKLGLWFGIAHVFVLAPLVINEFPYGWNPSVMVGKVSVVGLIVLWVPAWATKSVKVVVAGALGWWVLQAMYF